MQDTFWNLYRGFIKDGALIFNLINDFFTLTSLKCPNHQLTRKYLDSNQFTRYRDISILERGLFGVLVGTGHLNQPIWSKWQHATYSMLHTWIFIIHSVESNNIMQLGSISLIFCKNWKLHFEQSSWVHEWFKIVLVQCQLDQRSIFSLFIIAVADLCCWEQSWNLCKTPFAVIHCFRTEREIGTAR